MTVSQETSLAFRGINATRFILFDAMITHIPNSKGTGCVCTECMMDEVNKRVVLLQAEMAT